MKHILKLDDATVEELFGAEDAENETADRFRQYFYFNKAYDSLTSELPIRILVGHKGIGKSALLRRAYLRDQDNKRMSVYIRPSDLTEHRQNPEAGDFNLLIEQWKRGLLSSIAAKIIEDTAKAPLELSELKQVSSNAKSFISGVAKLLVKYADKKLDSSSAVLAKSFADNRLINVYIDDIDRGWSASASDIRNISALLNAIRDLSGAEQRIRFRIGLRSDVYFLVRTSDESTDKIERNVIWMKWSNHDILCVMAKRLETYFESSVDQSKIAQMHQSTISKTILSRVITPVFQGRGHWSNRPIHNVLLSLTRQRPRDLVKLMHGAAKNAYSDGKIVITSKNLEDSFSNYSAERLQDIINEFKSEMPEIERLLLNLRPTKKTQKAIESYLFTTDKLILRLKSILQNTPVSFRNGKQVTPKSLIQFLYKIDFITARKDHADSIERKYFDQGRFLASEIADFGYDWEIHPAYRWALQPQTVHDILDSIKWE
jgi:hypothetical protein